MFIYYIFQTVKNARSSANYAKGRALYTWFHPYFRT